MRLSGLFCLLFFSVFALRAATVPSMTADSSRIDLDTGETVFSGQARVELGDLRLEADEVRYDARARRVQATGRVVLHQAGRRVLAHRVTYDLGTETYQIENLRMGSPPLFLSGTSAEAGSDYLRLTNARATLGEPGRWAPTLSASTVTYFPERERLQAERARLGVGWWQPIPLPSAEISTHIPLLSYLSLNGGYSNSLGLALEAALRLPITEQWRIGPSVGLYSARGVMFGPTAAYQRGTRGDLDYFEGELDSGYIRDGGDRGVDLRRQAVPLDRGYLTWRHQQRFSKRLSLDLAVSYWSDSEVLRDFHPGDFFPVQVPDSYLDLQHTSPHAIVGLFLRGQANPYHRVQERLPELTLDLLPRPLAHGIVHRGHFAAAVLRESPPLGGPTLRSDRADTYHSLARPFTAGDWLTFTPLVGGRLTHYARAGGGRDDYTRTLGEIGADALARFHATFDYQNKRWGIDGLRHLVTPSISYRYLPRADRGRPHLPAIDRRAFSTYLEPLGLGDRRHLDELDATNTLRLAIGNRLQTRDPTHGSRDLISYQLAADFRFDPRAGQRHWSDLHSELRLTPAPWLDFEFYHRLDPHRGDTREFNTALVLHDADRWALRLATHHLAGDIAEYMADYTHRLNEVYSLVGRFHYDRRRSRFVEQTYGVRQVLDNRWVVGYELSFYDGPRRESSFGFRIVLDALSF